MSVILVDIECFHDFFYIGMKRFEDGKRIGVEFSTRKPDFNREFVRNIFAKNTTVGFNSFGYDLPMIWLALKHGTTVADLKAASDRIIKGGIRWWEVEDALGIRIPWKIKERHIDLIEPQPNAFASLKSLNGRMHGIQMQDLPYDPDIVPDHDQMDEIAHYCLHSDLDATENLYRTLEEPLALRSALGKMYGQDFRSKSDAQIGEAIIRKRVEQMTGVRPKKVETKPGTIFRYDVPSYIEFETPELQAVVEELRGTDFYVNSKGKIDLPAWLAKKKVRIGHTEYQMGIGGLHSTEANRSVVSNEDYVLIDADVASQYPSIIMQLGLVPKSLGKTFLEVYGDIRRDRLVAKQRAKDIKDELKVEDDPKRIADLKRELAQEQVKDKGAKIQLNGVYGKLGSRYSILYAPHLLIAVTLTGQLTLLMLAEQAEKHGISVVSGNTDGLLFYCPRDKYAGIERDRLNPCVLADVTDAWEARTGFDLEFGEYRAIYNQSVNSYYAIKPGGGHKRKGPIGNPWSKHPDDLDPVRGQLMKNPQATICSDAALAFIKDGTPIAQTVRACEDIRQFVTVIRASKGATWRGALLGKVVRYYWSTDGEPIYDAIPHPTTGNFKKVSKTDGAAECMRLPETLPADIDYDRYVAEAERIVLECGFYDPFTFNVPISAALRFALVA